MLDLLFFHDLGNIPLILPPAYEIFSSEIDRTAFLDILVYMC